MKCSPLLSPQSECLIGCPVGVLSAILRLQADAVPFAAACQRLMDRAAESGTWAQDSQPGRGGPLASLYEQMAEVQGAFDVHVDSVPLCSS